MSTKDLEKRVSTIEARNKHVEVDKAWETSNFRRISIAILTYFVVVIFMFSADIERPFVNAITPAIGFTLSTLTISKLKSWWINRK